MTATTDTSFTFIDAVERIIHAAVNSHELAKAFGEPQRPAVIVDDVCRMLIMKSERGALYENDPQAERKQVIVRNIAYEVLEGCYERPEIGTLRDYVFRRFFGRIWGIHTKES